MTADRRWAGGSRHLRLARALARAPARPAGPGPHLAEDAVHDAVGEGVVAVPQQVLPVYVEVVVLRTTPRPRPASAIPTSCAAHGERPTRGDAHPLLSPALAPDEAIRRLPLTHIQVGGFDPLLDDSVDFNTRIRRLGVPGDMRIHRTLPHTFFSFPHWHATPEVQQAMRTSLAWLEDSLWRGRAPRSD